MMEEDDVKIKKNHEIINTGYTIPVNEPSLCLGFNLIEPTATLYFTCTLICMLFNTKCATLLSPTVKEFQGVKVYHYGKEKDSSVVSGYWLWNLGVSNDRRALISVPPACPV